MRTQINRREFVQTAALASSAVLGSQILNLFQGGLAHAASKTKTLLEIQRFPRKYEIKPLPFKPENLKGFSSKLILSHHENNYGAAVKNLMKAEAEIAKLSPDALPFQWTGLKNSEHAFRNSMILHEQYFENLGGNGKVQGKVEKMISAAWGSISRFEMEFKISGVGVGGGTGWIILAWDLQTSQPIISSIGHNNQFSALSVPLLLMDVYEHAYVIDFGTGLKNYIEVFFTNINWEIVNKRLEWAEVASENLKEFV